ncbi:S-adenosylmethionine decarboxylase, partial [Stenotrophomonas maltophilia]
MARVSLLTQESTAVVKPLPRLRLQGFNNLTKA